MKLNLTAIGDYVKSEGGGRWELDYRASDGLVLIRFYNVHGSVFDVCDAADGFTVGE